MALTLVANPLDLNSNSFVTVADAEIYFSQRLNSEAWAGLTVPDDDDITRENKERTLIWASTVLSRSFHWKGTRVEEHQLLAFPRYDVYTDDGFLLDYDIYPRRIVEGVCELALYMTTQKLGEGSPFDEGLTEIKVGPIGMKFNREQLYPGGAVDGNGIPADINSIFIEYVKASTGPGGGVRSLIRT